LIGVFAGAIREIRVGLPIAIGDQKLSDQRNDSLQCRVGLADGLLERRELEERRDRLLCNFHIASEFNLDQSVVNRK